MESEKLARERLALISQLFPKEGSDNRLPFFHFLESPLDSPFGLQYVLGVKAEVGTGEPCRFCFSVLNQSSPGPTEFPSHLLEEQP